jgi:Tfp pilus assembly protein FimT
MLPMFNHYTKGHRGFSILEAVIVIGLIAIVAAIFLPAFYKIYQNYRSQTAVEQITMNIRFARFAAVKKRRFYRLTFNADPTNTYAVLMDENRDGTFEPYKNADTSVASGLKILTGGITSITFNARGAATLVGGNTIRVQSPNDDIYQINVLANGSVTKVKE